MTSKVAARVLGYNILTSIMEENKKGEIRSLKAGDAHEAWNLASSNVKG
jgi:hypothetical protein